MNILDKINIFKNDRQIVGLSAFNKEKDDSLSNPKIYTGDYSSMFKFDLEKRINPSVGQNLYYLS